MEGGGGGLAAGPIWTYKSHFPAKLIAKRSVFRMSVVLGLIEMIEDSV